jgi:hypothetical protein
MLKFVLIALPTMPAVTATADCAPAEQLANHTHWVQSVKIEQAYGRVTFDTTEGLTGELYKDAIHRPIDPLSKYNLLFAFFHDAQSWDSDIRVDETDSGFIVTLVTDFAGAEGCTPLEFSNILWY